MRIRRDKSLHHLTEKHSYIYEKHQQIRNRDNANSIHPEEGNCVSEASKVQDQYNKSPVDSEQNAPEILQLQDIDKNVQSATENDPNVSVHSRSFSNSEPIEQNEMDTCSQINKNTQDKSRKKAFFEKLFEKIADKSKWIPDKGKGNKKLRATARCLTCSAIIRRDYWLRHLKGQHKDIYDEYCQEQNDGNLGLDRSEMTLNTTTLQPKDVKEAEAAKPSKSPESTDRSTILKFYFEIILDKTQWIKEKPKKGKVRLRPTAQCLKCLCILRKNRMVYHLKVHHQDIYDKFIQLESNVKKNLNSNQQEMELLEDPKSSSGNIYIGNASQITPNIPLQEEKQCSENVDTLLNEMYPNIEHMEKVHNVNMRSSNKFVEKLFTKITDKSKWLSYGDAYRGSKAKKYPTSLCSICSKKVKSSKILSHLKSKHPNEHEEYLSYVEAEKANLDDKVLDQTGNEPTESCLDISMRYIDTIFEIMEKSEWVPYEHMGEMKLTPAYRCNLCSRSCRQDLRVLHLEKNHTDAFDQYLVQSRMVNEGDLSKHEKSNSILVSSQQPANDSIEEFSAEDERR